MSLWPKLADLPLVVEGYELDTLSAEMANGQTRTTIQVHIHGGGHEGLGEDVGVMPDDDDPVAKVPKLELAGEWTLGSFCDHLGTVEQWREPPEWELFRLWRNWSFESAALDLALRQAGRPLHEVLEREPRPLRFVNSLGLGDPPSTDTVHRRLARYPDIHFKLDAAAAWDLALCRDLAATDAVEVVDFKGQYRMEVEDEEALAAMYRHVVATFPDAILEDPHDLPEVAALVAPHAARVSFDAPIATAGDVETAAFGARTVNVKPSRIGSLEALLDVYAYCERNGIAMYGGGMGEVGVARGQIELLAALFHPDAPNDVAPSDYNLPELPAGLPPSPLTPPRGVTGFRWADS